MVSNPQEARFLLPLVYEHIQESKLSDEEAKDLIREAMKAGDAFVVKLERGLSLLHERFPSSAKQQRKAK